MASIPNETTTKTHKWIAYKQTTTDAHPSYARSYTPSQKTRVISYSTVQGYLEGVLAVDSGGKLKNLSLGNNNPVYMKGEIMYSIAHLPVHHLYPCTQFFLRLGRHDRHVFRHFPVPTVYLEAMVGYTCPSSTRIHPFSFDYY